MRTAQINRVTGETDISLALNLDGTGASQCDTGCGFLDHMLTLFARHGRFDLTVKCDGDTYVDDHHTVEDIGIALGKAFSDALGEKRGICRFSLSVFTEAEAGSEIYSRRDEEWQERCYTRAEVEEKLKAAGFEICGVFGNTKFKRAAKSDSKMYFAARAKK